MKKKILYSEPSEYFPKDVRKKHKLGEFAEQENTDGKSSPAEYDRWGRTCVKFNDESTFEKELERIYELKDKYDNMQMENYLVNGYDCLFLMCSYSTGKEENIDKYIDAWHTENYYGISWDLVMISESEMTIVYNLLRYDTRNFEKWEEREAYISEYFDLDLDAMAKELDED